MLKLYGFPISNYFNMARMALEHKGADYEVVIAYPSQEEDFLKVSPMGKVPCLVSDDGSLAETAVLMEYINDSVPGPALLPENAWEKAKVRQLIHSIELYLELPARRLYGGVYFGGVNQQHTIDEVKPVLEKGAATVAHLASFSPWIAGAEIGSADYFAYYTLDLACGVAQKEYGMDLMAMMPGAAEWQARMNELPAIQRFNAEKAEAMKAFLEMMKKKHGG